MILEEMIVQYLNNHPRSSAAFAGRVYPLVIPAGEALPAVAYQRISTIPDASHDGPGSLLTARVQFTVTGETYMQARRAAVALRLALDARAWMGCTSFLDGMSDDDASDPGRPVDVRIDYLISYPEIVSDGFSDAGY